MFEKLWGRFLSGTQTFSLFHARVMLNQFTLHIKKCHVEQSMQPLQPASIISLRSLPGMRLLNGLKVFWLICHPKTVSPSECLPYVTELYLGVEKSDCLKLYLELCS